MDVLYTFMNEMSFTNIAVGVMIVFILLSCIYGSIDSAIKKF